MNSHRVVTASRKQYSWSGTRDQLVDLNASDAYWLCCMPCIVICEHTLRVQTCPFNYFLPYVVKETEYIHHNIPTPFQILVLVKNASIF